MNPHNKDNPKDLDEQKSAQIHANEPDDLDEQDEDQDNLNEQDDLDEDDEEASEYDDEDEEEDDEDGEYDDDDDEDAPAKTGAPKSQTGRGLRSLAVVEEEEELPPSKTKIKKQMHELRDLGQELTELSKDQVAKLDIPESLRDAIKEMQRIKSFGAKRRQIQYIGKLMRDIDPAPILAKLDTWKGVSKQHIGYMHQIERWRERLLAGDSAFTELLALYPETDVQRLRTLIRNAIKEREAGKPGKNYRDIFQVLRETIPVPV
jgi:ribosome-associated protein